MTAEEASRSLGRFEFTDPREPSARASAVLEAKLFGPRACRLADRYTIEARLGSGGMGVVDRAFDERLRRTVAVKRLHRAAVGPADVAQLRAEAQVLATLSHPNVVAVFDIIEHEESVAMVMELVEGVSLQDWVRNPPSLARRLDALRQAATGLEAAHAHRMLHGDFKPSNLLIDEAGQVKICDFGLARSLDRRRTDEADPGPICGTPRFMSPEQHSKDPLTPASDQYSFCVAAWILLTGDAPFGPTNSPSLLALSLIHI